MAGGTPTKSTKQKNGNGPSVRFRTPDSKGLRLVEKAKAKVKVAKQEVLAVEVRFGGEGFSDGYVVVVLTRADERDKEPVWTVISGPTPLATRAAAETLYRKILGATGLEEFEGFPSAFLPDSSAEVRVAEMIVSRHPAYAAEIGLLSKKELKEVQEGRETARAKTKAKAAERREAAAKEKAAAEKSKPKGNSKPKGKPKASAKVSRQSARKAASKVVKTANSAKGANKVTKAAGLAKVRASNEAVKAAVKKNGPTASRTVNAKIAAKKAAEKAGSTKAETLAAVQKAAALAGAVVKKETAKKNAAKGRGNGTTNAVAKSVAIQNRRTKRTNKAA